MIVEAPKYKPKEIINWNKKLKNDLNGYLNDKEAKISLAKFLKYNLRFTTDLLTGGDLILYPYQEMIINAWFQRNFCMNVYGRGCGKCLYLSDNQKVIEKDKGLIGIKTLLPDFDFSNGEKWVDIPLKNIWDGKTWKRVNKVLLQPNKEYIKIKTKMGYNIEAALTHKMKFLDVEKCQIVWKRLGEISNFEKYKLCISRNECEWNIIQDENQKKHAYSLGEKMGKEGIPKQILESSTLCKHFLHGFFRVYRTINGYGFDPSLLLGSEEIIDQVHKLLLSFGIISKVTKINSNKYVPECSSLSLNKENLSLFYKKIVFDLCGDKKQSKKDLGKDEDLKESFFFDEAVEVERKFGNCIDFNVPNEEMYWCNGFINHNSSIASFFIPLYHLFNPGTKTCIASANFRSSRRILDSLEKIIKSKNAHLLRQVFPHDLHKGPGQWTYKVEDGENGEVFAIPLTEGTRGIRCNVLILDEFLLLSQDIVEKVLFPFLSVKSDQNFKIKVRAAENRLIKAGKMKEEDRMTFPNTQKMICLSSASYEFEYLYKKFCQWKNNIIEDLDLENLSEEEKDVSQGASYFVAQLAWNAVPETLIDHTIVREAQEGGSKAVFDREFNAQFVDDSDSFFSAKKLAECTVPPEEFPVVELKGDYSAEYVLGIDPNASTSPTADHFAMSLLKVLDKQNAKTCLVHSYAQCTKGLRHAAQYVYYILSNFNVKYIIIDNGGGENFIEFCNETSLFKDNEIKLEFFNADFDNAIKDTGLIKKAKLDYMKNKNKWRIVHQRTFPSAWIRFANEYLQACVEKKKIWFASKLQMNKSCFDKAMSVNIEQVLEVKKRQTLDDAKLDFICEQDDLIDLTKKECVLIEVTETAQGSQRFDLPKGIKKSQSPNKPRKDNYSSLLMANWGTKCYLEMSKFKEEVEIGFTPFFVA